jgi:hypothetical protein
MERLFVLFLIFFIALQCSPSYATRGVVNERSFNIEDNGGLAVNVQDQTSPPFDLYFIQLIGSITSLTAPAAIDDLIVSLASVADCSVGNYFSMNATDGSDRFYFGEVLAVGASTVTLDTPVDYAFAASDPAFCTTRDLNVDGSVTSQVFDVRGSGPASDIEIDVTRLILEITTSGAPPFDGFGDIAGGLTAGIVLRRVDGDTRNIWNVKTNSEFANIAYDYTTLSGFGPAVEGIIVRYTFAGQDKHGVAVRLAAGDRLELIVQDDLTSLLSFRVIAAGHIVTD